jgi:hypothetical protein
MKNRYTRLLCAAGLALITLPCLAEVALSDKLRGSLQGYEWQAGQYSWQADMIPELVAVAESETEALFLRRRAVAALAAIESEIATSALISLAQNHRLGTVQRRAIDELCQVQLTTQAITESNAVVKSLMLSLLTGAEPQTRFRAASCLRQFGEEQGVLSALDEYYLTASDWERRLLESTVSEQ